MSHNPRLKSQMKKLILAILYEPYELGRRKVLNEIIQRNCVLQKISLDMFTYKGSYFSYSPIPTRLPKPKLHPDLHVKMDAWLAEEQSMSLIERPYIDGYVTSVLNSSNEVGDWLRLLPDSIQGSIRTLLLGNVTYPTDLPDEEIIRILEVNSLSIQLMKERMARNLLLS